MYKANNVHYQEIRTYLDQVPVIESHEHYTGVVHPVEDVLCFITDNYYASDMNSAAFGTEKDVAAIQSDQSTDIPFEERFECFKSIYKKSNKTAYARGMQIGLKECWGIENLDDITSLKELETKLQNRDQSFYENMMTKYLIKAKIVDIFDILPYVEGKINDYSRYCRFAFPLPSFHDIHQKNDMVRFSQYLGRSIVCLDDYLECFENLFKKSLDFGIVCIKDQSAYRRTISYLNPTKAEAEKAFNDIIYSPRDLFGDDRVQVLDDWLFHYFMRIAAKYDIPVQLHTGHMAGIRNEVTKTNAVHLTPVIELHQDVRFDLFHGNWPYMGEYLFLGKNYPNVWLNLCWVQMIDPIYSVELMKRAIMTVPHAKVFAFGGDTMHIEWAVGYLSMARDNVACALSELVESGWLNIAEAKEIAADWFFNNPNEFFKLGFHRFES